MQVQCMLGTPSAITYYRTFLLHKATHVVTNQPSTWCEALLKTKQLFSWSKNSSPSWGPKTVVFPGVCQRTLFCVILIQSTLLHPLMPANRFNITLQCISIGKTLEVIRPTFCKHFSFPPCVLYVPTIISFLI
jgi:hypothetical protein